jgi:intein/homing endonuclease
MRTYDQIYTDFCNFMANKLNNESLTYENLKIKYGEDDAKVLVYKNLLKKCYDKKDGFYFFITFVVGDMTDIGMPKPFKYNKLVRIWDRLIKRHEKLCILSARGHGKCLNGNTLITLPNGKRKKLMDMKSGDKVISISDEYTQEIDTVNYMKYVGDKKEYTLQTYSGNEIKGADTHKFLTINGWKELKDLKQGDYIATPRTIESKDEYQTISENDAYLIGWLISEGKSISSIWQKDTKVLKTLHNICNKLGYKSKIITNNRSELRLSTLQLKKLDIYKYLQNKNSYTKYIHEEFFNQPSNVKWKLISSLFEGDGYLDCRRSKNHNISYSSVSRQLIYDLKHLLLTLGIHSLIKKTKACMVTKKTGKVADVYNLYINRENIVEFLNNTEYITKQDQKETLLKYFKNTKRNSNIDIIPKFGIFKDMYISDSYESSRYTYEKFVNKHETRLSKHKIGSYHYKNNMSILNNNDFKKLKNIVTGNVFWDKITSITEGDIIPMYDIEVRKNHTYIANDIYTHNTQIFSNLYNLYDMFLFKFKRIIIVSASQDQANRILEDMKNIVENNEMLVERKARDKWASTTFGFNGGYVIGAGIGSEILGQHVDRITVDDVLRSDNKLTDEQIEDYIDMVLDPMLLNRDGQMILVGTPRTATDIFSVIENRIDTNDDCPWMLYRFPAIIDEEKQILQCPERFTFDQLMKKKASMGGGKFDREYQLLTYSRDQTLFPEKMLTLAMEQGKDRVLLDMADKRSPNWTFIAGADVARSGSVGADYTVVTVLAYDSISQKKEIVHFWRSKGMKITEQARHISEICRAFGNCMICVEKNNVGVDLIDSLIDEYNVFVEPITVGGAAKKEELVRFLITSFEHEQIVIPQGDEFSRDQMKLLVNELGKFSVEITNAGNERYRAASGHDDCTASLYLANKGTQIGGTPFAVVDGESSEGSMYSSLTNSFDSEESDIVKLIKLGLIK